MAKPKKKILKESYNSVQLITKFFILLILGYLIYFFLGVAYDKPQGYLALISLISLAVYAYSWRRGLFSFFVVAFSSITLFISLEISFNLPLFIMLILSLLVGIVGYEIYKLKKSPERYAEVMLVLFIIVWIILGFNVSYRHDWILENLLTIPFVLLIVIAYRWFKLSRTSITLIFLYMFLHIIGSHYTYAEVPYGFWMQNFFDLERNHYDRIVHFCFGFLLAYPIREVFSRIGHSRGFWTLYLPIELVFGFSAIYEIIEWWVVLVFGGDLGIAYLGSQGDIWDAQWDMFLAGFGSFIAMIITAIVIFSFKGKAYWEEIKGSFKVEKQILGEEALKRMGKIN